MNRGPTQIELLTEIALSNQQQTEYLLHLVDVTNALHRSIRQIDNKRPRRSSWDIATSIGYVLGFLGTLSAAGIAYFGSNSQSGNQTKTEICKLAIESLNDESPNPLLSPEQKRKLIDSQAQLAHICIQDAMK
jgi:hypothetical protein